MTAQNIIHRPYDELEAALDDIRESPQDAGTVELIVRRPAENEREVLEEGILDLDKGLVGDTWHSRPSKKTDDGSAHPEMQINLMNARVAALVAVEPDRRQLAGDQFYVDLDLSFANLPPGTQLAIGTAVLEVTEHPHRGCAKFSERFGVDALKFVNSEVGAELNLRGINARIVQAGVVRRGDAVRRNPY